MSKEPYYFRKDAIHSCDLNLSTDICVYGATAAGVITAIAVAQRGRQVVLLNPARHVGGMTSGGLSWTDFGKQYAIGGMSLEFYKRCGKHYGQEFEWRFEPRVALKVLEDWLAETDVQLFHEQFLDTAQMPGKRIASITMLGGMTVNASMFVDATYEGDLLAKAGVSYTVGREGNEAYGETYNGIQIPLHHQFSHPVDPYVVEGDPASGLLPNVIANDQSQQIGQGDKRIQAYNFRICMTDDPAIKIDWEKPAQFDESQYVLASRWLNGEKDQYGEHLTDKTVGGAPLARKFDILTPRTANGLHKTDTNNHGAVSSDFIGANYDWPEGDYEARQRLFEAHVTYQKGLYWYIANAPSIPKRYRDAYAHWGLAADEFEDTNNWPHQLYVREARRMVSDYVITQHDCMEQRTAEDSVGLASYNMDSHNCIRFMKVEDGKPRVLNEGDVQVPPTDPYPVSYRSIIPRQGECENLLVPVCVSASHISFGSVRMEPVFMLLGQSAAIAADIALSNKSSVQDVSYGELRPQLLAAGQILDRISKPGDQ